MAAVARVLVAAYAINETADGIAHVLHLPKTAVLAALGLVKPGTAHRPNARLHGVARTEGSVREVRDNEAYYRAAYVMHAAHRINASLKSGHTLGEAITIERPNTRAHEQARRNRLEVAVRMQRLADQFGPLLGWYRDPTSDSETECVVADGHNFDAVLGTVIGFPGSVHPHCHCVAGPPHEDGGMVNDHVSVAPKAPRTFKLKK